MKPVAVVILATLVAACASHPVNEATASSVAPARLTAPAAMRSPCDGCGELIVTRDVDDNSKLAFDMHLSIDGTKVAEINGGEKATFWLQPGKHVLTVRLTGQGFGLANEPSATVAIQPGQTQHYRLGVDFGGGFIKPGSEAD